MYVCMYTPICCRCIFVPVSELWGSAGIPLLFWSCANDIIQIDQVRLYAYLYVCMYVCMFGSNVFVHVCMYADTQAKRIYPLMSLIGNLGPILSGFTMASGEFHVATYLLHIHTHIHTF